VESDLEQFVVHLQALNRHLRSSVFDQHMQPVTRVQWLLMRRLHHKGGSTIGQLAEHLDVRASTMSQMLDRLEKQDYVTREQDVLDARVKIIKLTPAGEAIIEQMQASWLQSLAEPFEHLGKEEQDTLVQLMKKLANHLPRRGDV